MIGSRQSVRTRCFVWRVFKLHVFNWCVVERFTGARLLRWEVSLGTRTEVSYLWSLGKTKIQLQLCNDVTACIRKNEQHRASAHSTHQVEITINHNAAQTHYRSSKGYRFTPYVIPDIVSIVISSLLKWGINGHTCVHSSSDPQINPGHRTV